MENDQLKGIGGWLILILIGMIGALLQAVFTIMDQLDNTFYLTMIQKTILTYVTGANHPALGVWLLYIIMLNVIVIVFILCLLILMFTKSRFFPKMTIAYLIVVTILQVIYMVLGYVILPGYGFNPSADGLIGSLVMAATIIPYLLVSKRVKATYLRKSGRGEKIDGSTI